VLYRLGDDCLVDHAGGRLRRQDNHSRRLKAAVR
jgi:hypothetical protein